MADVTTESKQTERSRKTAVRRKCVSSRVRSFVGLSAGEVKPEHISCLFRISISKNSHVTSPLKLQSSWGNREFGTNAFWQIFLRSWDSASSMYSSKTNKMQRYTMVFITVNALHVSGGSSAHHQELKSVYTASGVCRVFSASYRYREWVLPTHSR